MANPEAWVAQQNIERYQATGKLDLDYLASLGADATPVIEQGLPANLARCMITWQSDPDFPDDWLGWNLGRARAADVAAYSEVLPGHCSSQIGQ